MQGKVLAIAVLAIAMAGCHKINDGDSGADSLGQKSPGRYAGIGTFEAGRLWQQTKGAAPSKDSAVAGLADDEHVIVVIDSHTGEVRQCGDHSGFCVAMNPWSGAGAAGVPVKLTKHAADLDAESNASSAEKPK